MVRIWGPGLPYKLGASFCVGKAGFVCSFEKPWEVQKEKLACFPHVLEGYTQLHGKLSSIWWEDRNCGVTCV